MTERTLSNAPEEVRLYGGLAMSLWMMGTNETDCILAARMKQRQNHFEAQAARLRNALRGAREDLAAVSREGFDSERHRVVVEGIRAINTVLDSCDEGGHFDRYRFYESDSAESQV